MSVNVEQTPSGLRRFVSLARLQGLGDAIFAFSLTLLALDLRVPAALSSGLGQAIITLLPKLLIFFLTFLIVAQEWDVHQRTMLHIARADGLFIWLSLLSLMFVVLMPTSADLLGNHPTQALALTFFGVNTILLCLASWLMWQHATHAGLLDEQLEPNIIQMISRLWIFPAVIIAITIPLCFITVYPVYLIWVLLPVISYSYSSWLLKRHR